MVILIVEKAPARLRGELTRWMIEPKAGMFVGTMSAMVRDRLWERTVKEMKDRGCMMIHSAGNEQGFSVRAHGDTTRKVIDIQGLQLVSTWNPE